MSYPTMDPENLNFEKMKKTPEDIIILQMYTINGSHMMYVSWNMESNRQNFSSFWTIFYTFTPLTHPKNQNFEKNKKKPSGDIIILREYHKWQSYDVWFLRYGVKRTEFFVILHSFLPFYPHWQPKRSSFYICVPKIIIRWCMAPEIWCTTDGRMDRGMDKRMEKVTHRGGCPPKN